MLKLTFWMNMPSFYQADLFRALVRTGKVDLHIVFSQRIPPDRQRLGWTDDLAGFHHEFLSDRARVLDAVSNVRNNPSGFHIVGGLWAGKVAEAVLITLMLKGAQYLVYSEAPDPRFIVPRWKQMILQPLGRQIIKKARGILSISHFAHHYFRSYGAEDTKIHPFGYFRSYPRNIDLNPPRDRNKGIEIVFVGQMVSRKGVDILLLAIEPLLKLDKNLSLHLIGSGELEQHFRKWVNDRNLSHRIKFDGTVSPRDVLQRISQADALVLPSRWDGWGIVVNEGFMASVPVIVSSMCGSADLVKDGVNGFTFPSEHVQDLREKLRRFISDTALRARMKKSAKKTGSSLTADVAAQYLIALLEGSETRNEHLMRGYPWAHTGFS